MRLELTKNPHTMRLVLSRRNLLALLHKLDMPESEKTIGCRDIYVDGIPISGEIRVSCEEDAEHYIARESPGEMHPETESFIKDKTDA